MCGSRYNLNDFCNIIARLRKSKLWTQTILAEKIGVSPQSISKWECGIGYPDVTLFPVIAEVLSVPIGVLFGEKAMPVEANIYPNNDMQFDICKNIIVSLGNVCHVEFLEEVGASIVIRAHGDNVFRYYFDVEQTEDTLYVNIKNPSGSAEHWHEYDRLGYDGENLVQIFTGCERDTVNINVLNYLDLKAVSGENEQGNYEVRCCKI